MWLSLNVIQANNSFRWWDNRLVNRERQTNLSRVMWCVPHLMSSKERNTLLTNQKQITMKAINRIVDVIFLGLITTAVALTIVMMVTGHVHSFYTGQG